MSYSRMSVLQKWWIQYRPTQRKQKVQVIDEIDENENSD